MTPDPKHALVLYTDADGLCRIRTTEGETLRCSNGVFPRLLPGAPVIAWSSDNGEWSLRDPRWYVNGEAPESRLTHGDFVRFYYDHADDHDPMLLHGTACGLPAVVRREDLNWPRNLPFCPEGRLRTLYVPIADPTARPLVMGRGRKAPLHSTDGPRFEVGPYLLGLHAIAEANKILPATVLGDGPNRLTLDLYGVTLGIYPERRTWWRDCPSAFLSPGRPIPVRVFVDLRTSSVEVSLRSTEGPEWREAVSLFPVGARIQDARLVARTSEGLLFDIPSSRLCLQGLVPHGELTDGADPYHFHDDRNDPGDLVVLGHDERWQRLTLSARRAAPPVWERLWFQEGQEIPVRALVYDAPYTWVRWAPGQVTRIRNFFIHPGPWGWARVARLDPKRQVIELAPPSSRGRGRVEGRIEEVAWLRNGPKVFLASQAAPAPSCPEERRVPLDPLAFDRASLPPDLPEAA